LIGDRPVWIFGWRFIGRKLYSGKVKKLGFASCEEISAAAFAYVLQQVPARLTINRFILVGKLDKRLGCQLQEHPAELPLLLCASTYSVAEFYFVTAPPPAC
jgi:hypothetical protein